VLEHVLTRERFRVTWFERGDDALAGIPKALPALIVLDLNLPGMDGLEVFRRLRADPVARSIPVIMLTARTDEVDRIVGLSLGAEDYVTKPFSPRELVLRIRAVLRPLLEDRRDEPRFELTAGQLTLFPAEHLLRIAGREVLLTPTECRLLHALIERAGRIIERDALIEAVWGGRADVAPRTLDVHVHRLRRKLGRLAPCLGTEPGIGYVLRP